MGRTENRLSTTPSLIRLYYLPIFANTVSMVCPSIPFLAGGTTYTNSLLVSVATHLAFGGGLFYGVLKFFEEVEKKLNPDTRLGIAVWLLDLHPSQNVQGWRSTFAKIFERVFGWKHMSWKCFWRSCAVTVIMTLIVMLA